MEEIKDKILYCSRGGKSLKQFLELVAAAKHLGVEIALVEHPSEAQSKLDNITKYIDSKIEEFNEFLMDLLAKEDSESKVKYGYYKDMRDIYQNLLNKIKKEVKGNDI